MRLLTLALLGLMLAASPALATRSGPAHAGSSAAPAKAAGKAPLAKSRAAAAPPRTAGPAPARLQQAAWQPAAGCSRKARHCRGPGLAKAAHFGWTQGLPAAAGVQANECPDGTLATLARGHDDVVRCMPI